MINRRKITGPPTINDEKMTARNVLPSEMFEWLQEQSDKTRLNMAQIMRNCIQKEMDRQRKRAKQQEQ